MASPPGGADPRPVRGAGDRASRRTRTPTRRCLTQDAAQAGDGFDAFVFDSFRLDADAHRAIARGKPTMVIDDLADRPLDMVT